MPQYQWSPPIHPDPPEDQPLGVDGVEWSEWVDHRPVWVRVEFTRTGWQKAPGFVDAMTDTLVYVQLVHMGLRPPRLAHPRPRDPAEAEASTKRPVTAEGGNAARTGVTPHASRSA